MDTRFCPRHFTPSMSEIKRPLRILGSRLILLVLVCGVVLPGFEPRLRAKGGVGRLGVPMEPWR